MTITLPIRIESLNKILTHHWAQRYRRNTSQQLEVYTELRRAKAPTQVPCRVTLTRIAPRAVDGHDNLQGGFKNVADAVALWLHVDDADERVQWVYAQRKGAPKTYGVEIQIEAGQ
jgi:hypothetical protein